MEPEQTFAIKHSFMGPTSLHSHRLIWVWEFISTLMAQPVDLVP